MAKLIIFFLFIICSSLGSPQLGFEDLKSSQGVSLDEFIEGVDYVMGNEAGNFLSMFFHENNLEKYRTDVEVTLANLQSQDEKEVETINQIELTKQLLENLLSDVKTTKLEINLFKGQKEAQQDEPFSDRLTDLVLEVNVNPFLGLGAYPEVSDKYFNRGDDALPLYNETVFGLINEDDYCNRVDKYNLEHPERMFSTTNFFTDYPYASMPRKKIEEYGELLMKHIHKKMRPEESSKPQYRIDTNIINFYTNLENFYEYHKIGQHFACVTQMHNHIPGNGVMVRKDLILEKLKLYREKFANRPQCFDPNMFFLAAYRLSVEQECREFFQNINSQAYLGSLADRPIQYLIKIGFGAHKSQGVFLLDEEKTQSLNQQYENGRRCGEESDPLIAQKYIESPLLLDLDNKFDFRIYMLIASTNPLILYYHDGYLRVSLNKFDTNSKDMATHLTNTFLANKVINKAVQDRKGTNGMTPQELADYHLWDMDDLLEYLLETGKITDPDWLDNYLRPLFQKAFIHLVKMSSEGFWKQSNVYELHGLDFMLDSDLNLWFIESNPNPLLSGVKTELVGQMLLDAFEIQYAYYRSRMKRVLNVINRMQEESQKNGFVDYNKWKQDYHTAVKNKLEPEYQISNRNTFVLIMDESRPRNEAYFGHVPSECFTE